MLCRRRLAGLVGPLLLGPTGARANPINLIQPQEAQLPPPRETPSATRSITRGPIVRLVAPGPSPLSVNGQFWLRLEFAGRGGALIDPASLRVRYLRAWEVDISERFRPFVNATALEVREAFVPPGRHFLKIDIRDDGGRPGEALIEILMS